MKIGNVKKKNYFFDFVKKILNFGDRVNFDELDLFCILMNFLMFEFIIKVMEVEIEIIIIVELLLLEL